ncbi:hypothetical protein Y032_0035g3110 [Ancylostoma ceylanicum]|uniref:Uncharacterized protein n=1 Tax=Ancylostoma ceylanicum TaxID=53326 RepID=A0A016UL03_9BILA|nr:hypothetical protein Y032_0035g3110 [Ancylostoma ceylanicum]
MFPAVFIYLFIHSFNTRNAVCFIIIGHSPNFPLRGSLRTMAASLALLGGDPKRQHSPDIEVFSHSLTKTSESVAQIDAQCSLAFSDVWRRQTMFHPLTGQVCFCQEVKPKTEQQPRKIPFPEGLDCLPLSRERLCHLP